MRLLLVMAPVAILTLISACTTTATRTDAQDENVRRDIEAVVRAQEAAWNRGDVAGFMEAGYWRSPDMTFFSESDATRGFEPVLERYVARYKTGGAEMGSLTFAHVEVMPLGMDAAFVRGRWDLDFAQRPDVGGLFTLVFRRIDGRWRIVHDHTSL